jgi:Stage III sporulation protein AC/AD protein family
MSYKTVGKLSHVCALQHVAPELNLFEYEQILEGRRFSRWYAKNKKAVDACAGIATFGAMKLLKVSPMFLIGTLFPQIAIPVAGGTLFSGHGVILLHMLIIGFVTLVVTTFLKFTGRGDLAPLVMFVGGAVILYECLELFHDIYKAVATFLNL